MDFHLAQINVARTRTSPEDPAMADFIAALDEVNAIADRSPGFVWRHQTAAGNAMEVRPYQDPRVLVNLSVWASVADLKAYVYGSLHAKFFTRRAEWFEKSAELHLALWWIPAGTVPTVDEAKERLQYRREHGDTPHAFSFQKVFAASRD